jgi:hypothetical protein
MSQTVNRAISIAQLKFAGDDGVFNTACFQSAMREITGDPLGDTVATYLLTKHPRVSQLSGGCHWRYEAETAKKK